MIENGNSQALEKLLGQSAVHINKSSDGSSPVSTSKYLDSGKKTRFSCMRMDRHFSALVFACHANQLDCLQILFEHGKELTKDSHDTFIKEWLGGQAEQSDCLFYAANHNNADMLHYLLKDVKLGDRVNEKKLEESS